MTLILVILVLAIIFGAGGYGFRTGNYYGPGGIAGVLLLILLILWLTGGLRVR